MRLIIHIAIHFLISQLHIFGFTLNNSLYKYNCIGNCYTIVLLFILYEAHFIFNCSFGFTVGFAVCIVCVCFSLRCPKQHFTFKNTFKIFKSSPWLTTLNLIFIDLSLDFIWVLLWPCLKELANRWNTSSKKSNLKRRVIYSPVKDIWIVLSWGNSVYNSDKLSCTGFVWPSVIFLG